MFPISNHVYECCMESRAAYHVVVGVAVLWCGKHSDNWWNMTKLSRFAVHLVFTCALMLEMLFETIFFELFNETNKRQPSLST